MEVENQRAKGGFFQLFDWKVKSRKKLFSSKCELPENSNQRKETFHGSVIARRQQGLEQGFPSNGIGQNDHHYVSSASGDSEYETKPPGVVARLMGLDSLPTSSNVTELCCNNEHDIVIFESIRNKLDGSSRNPLDSRMQKVLNRPIERFQTEVLPPKSAKPVSVTRHRLLSPIKSPGFIPPKNAVYIIEAAARIIEQSPRATTKGKLPSLGSSSIPFRIRELRENMEAARKSSRSAETSQKKKQLNDRGQGRSDDNYLYKGSDQLKRVGSQRLKSKEKSVSLAVQAKTNIQKRDGCISVGKRSTEKQKEYNGVKTSCDNRNLPSTQKTVEKQGSLRRPSEVLRLNHQKQNCVEGENFEASCSYTKDRKSPNLSTNYVNGRANRTVVNKIVIDNVVTSRKMNFVTVDTGKEISSMRAKTTSKKKLPINGNIQSGAGVAQKGPMAKEEKSVKCNISFEGDSKWGEIDKKNSLDVVSFTFTSPIKKSGAGINSCGTTSELSCSSVLNSDPSVCESDSRSSATPSSGFNHIGGDALSVLLEQKLKELSSRVELSQKDISESGSFSNSTNSHENICPMIDDICKRKQEVQNASDNNPSVDKHRLKAEKETKELEFMEKDEDNSNIEYQRYLRLQGPVSVPNQPSFSGVSCDSFDFDRSSSNEGSFPCLSLESYEGTNWSYTRKSHQIEEISDTASSSSLSVGTMSETITSTLYINDPKDSSYWELQYISDIINGSDLMSEEFALGQAHQIVPPDLFDRLENQKIDSSKERKVLFDCVSECLEMRCGRVLAGSCKLWAKQKMMLHRKQWLAEELYRDISGWINVEELMVDELVDKDMSLKNGKWIDFEVEVFEEGVEIERRILSCLVDEMIDDFLF